MSLEQYVPSNQNDMVLLTGSLTTGLVYPTAVFSSFI